MNSTIKRPGGNLVRVLSAVGGFKQKYGRWPTGLKLYETALADLAVRHLTPLGLFLLQSKLSIEIGHDIAVIATGSGAESFDYGQEMERFPGDMGASAAWLGLDLSDQ